MDYGLAFGALVMVMAVVASGAATAYYALMGDTFPARERERVFGVIAATASLIGTVAMPMAIGVALDRVSVRASLVVLAGAPAIGLLGALVYRVVSPARRVSLAQVAGHEVR